MTLRLATRADLDACLALTAATHAEHRTRFPENFPAVEQTTQEQWLRSALGGAARHPFYEDAKAIVCAQGETFLGYVLWVTHRVERGAGDHELVGVIGDITIRPEYRGRGLGRRLLGAAREALSGAGVTRMIAHVWDGNDASERLFLAEGFQPAYLEMQLRLAPPIPEPCPPLKQASPIFWRQLAIESFAIFGVISLVAILFLLARPLVG